MKFLVLLLILATLLFAGRGDNYDATDCAKDVVECDVSSGDVTVDPENTRGVMVDTAGVVKIRIRPIGGSGVQKDLILTFDGAGYYAIGGVTKVYRYITGTTPATTKIIKAADATSTTGVKILK